MLLCAEIGCEFYGKYHYQIEHTPLKYKICMYLEDSINAFTFIIEQSPVMLILLTSGTSYLMLSLCLYNGSDVIATVKI